MRDKNIVKVKSFKFSIKIINLYKMLLEEKEFIISKRLLRSATSIEEAKAGGFFKYFTTIKSIASKEAWKRNIGLNN